MRACITFFALFSACGSLDTYLRPEPQGADAGAPPVYGDVVDILFIVHNGLLMPSIQDELAEASSTFINALSGRDYRIAVIPSNEEGACASAVIDVRDGDEPSRAEALATALRLGNGGQKDESLVAMRAAIMQRGARQGCNSFLRDNAHLIFIFVSDVDEAGDTPLLTYIEELLLLKYDPSVIRLAMIVGARNSEASTCGTHAQPGRRYVEFANAWERAVIERAPSVAAQECVGTAEPAVCLIASVCEASFDDTYRWMASALIPEPLP